MSVLETFFDQGSFVELGAFMLDAEVACGYGLVNDKLVYAYCQTGTISKNHAKKIAGVYDSAIKVGAPVLAILGAKGVRLDDGMETMDAYGLIFNAQARAAGVILQLAVINGACMGTSAYITSFSDFVIMNEKNGSLFLQSPNTYDGGSGQGADAAHHKTVTGLTHFTCSDEISSLAKVKELLSVLPSNNLDEVSSACTDDLNREDISLSGDDICVEKIIQSISDNNFYLQPQESYAAGMPTFLCRMGGITTGIIANNGLIDSIGAEKASRFVSFCDAFNIPIITLTNVTGYVASLKDDAAMIYSGGKLMRALLNASVGKINIVLKNAIGGSYLIMNSKQIGADLDFSWSKAIFALVDDKAGKKVLGMDLTIDAIAAAQQGFTDCIIEPAATRKRIIAGLFMLSHKRTLMPGKKHSGK